MIDFINSIIIELSDKQAEVIIAGIGLISAAIVSVIGLFGSTFTIILNKIHERKVELRKIKECQYIEFLQSLAKAKIAKDNDRYEINACLSARIQTIYLVGNKDVQEKLKAFLSIFNGGPVETIEQNRLYAELILAMKKDLYGKCKNALDSIPFTVFTD